MRFPLICATCLFLTPQAHAQAAMPEGMIFYVQDELCPAGTVTLEAAQGRLMMADYDAADWGKTNAAEPFGDYTITVGDKEITVFGEKPHSHPITMKMTIPEKKISGWSSCCNKTPTKHDDYDSETTALNTTSELPYVTLTVCVAN